MVILVIWAILLEIACIVVVVQAARAKNREPQIWGAVAFVFGVFSLAMIAVVPALPSDEVGDPRYQTGTRDRNGAIV